MKAIVTVRQDVLGGMPCFAGTRVPADSLFTYLAHGHTIEYFLEQFPSVQRDQIEALLEQSKRHLLADAAVVDAA